MRAPFASPDYTTICRREQSLQINLAGKIHKNARHILVDATGVRVFGEGEWKGVNTWSKQRRRLWRKLHIAIDADTQEILAATVTESVRLDCSLLPVLIDNIEGTIRQITGAAYDKHQCYRLAHKRHAKPVFSPQKNSSIQRNKIKH